MQDISVIFENQYIMMRKLNKALYEQRMNQFRDDYGSLINDLLSEVKESEDAPTRVGSTAVDQIFASYEKRGKIKKTLQMELELFMIYFLFPAILLTQDSHATVLCDCIRDSWNTKFSKNINYTDYQTMYDGFVTKIFGVPVGQ